MRTTYTLGAALALAVTLPGCRSQHAAVDAGGANHVVDVVALGRTFEAPDSIPAGWTTFRFHNASTMTHFAVVERLPDGIGIKEQQTEAAPVFQAGMDLLDAGKPKEAMAKFGELPAWFAKVQFLGGAGLTAPGHTSETAIHLEPGTYLLECYVKTNGTFHSYNPDSGSYGMVHQLVVTAPESTAPEPNASLTLTLSSEHGIEVSGTPTVGTQTVAVHFADQHVYANFVGHDVHLVHLADDTDLKSLVAWMDWTRHGGLQTPAPAEFLGGVNEMPAGSTGYLTVTLHPGRYAWISEVPNAEVKGMLRVFTVPGAGGDVASGS